MKLAVPREIQPGETRVALVPESVKKLIGAGFQVAIETGAGTASGYGDSLYTEVGAAIATDTASLLKDAGFILKVGVPTSKWKATLLMPNC